MCRARSSSVTLRQLALLQSEVPILGRNLARETTALCECQLHLLRKSLGFLVIGVLDAHEDLLDQGSLREVKQLLTQQGQLGEEHSQLRTDFQFVSGLQRNHYFPQFAEKYLRPCLLLQSHVHDTRESFGLSSGSRLAVYYCMSRIGLMTLPYDQWSRGDSTKRGTKI